MSLKEWRPSGEQVTEVLSADGVTAVLEKWHGALDVAAVAEKSAAARATRSVGDGAHRS